MDFSSPLSLRIRKTITQGLSTYNMLQEGDRLLICVSGGKDSSVLLALMKDIQRRAPFNFEIEAAMLDQKQPGFNPEPFIQWVKSLEIPFHLIERDTYSIVKEKTPEGQTYCSLCSRLRRAILYDFAFDNKFTKVALGHHRDDILHTALLNLFYVGQLSTMPPKLLSDDGRNTLIRPLCFVDEKEIESLAKEWDIPILPCNLCGSQDGLKRQRMKTLLQELSQEIPQIRASMMSALAQVQPSHLLDKDLWDFENLGLKENRKF